jgi:phosphopantothenoylcysteine decarboxylase
VAPLSANTLAKIANGICDNLLVFLYVFNIKTCILRAWDRTKPIIMCPAMNTHMYDHPITAVHLNTIKSFNYEKCVILGPISKKLACGDVGMGAMAEVSDIVKVLNDVLE